MHNSIRPLLLLIPLAGLMILGCKREDPKFDSSRKPDVAEQIANGEQPSGADVAKGAAESKN